MSHPFVILKPLKRLSFLTFYHYPRLKSWAIFAIRCNPTRAMERMCALKTYPTISIVGYGMQPILFEWIYPFGSIIEFHLHIEFICSLKFCLSGSGLRELSFPQNEFSGYENSAFQAIFVMRIIATKITLRCSFLIYDTNHCYQNGAATQLKKFLVWSIESVS